LKSSRSSLFSRLWFLIFAFAGKRRFSGSDVAIAFVPPLWRRA
jgi:hypothetical protein